MESNKLFNIKLNRYITEDWESFIKIDYNQLLLYIKNGTLVLDKEELTLFQNNYAQYVKKYKLNKKFYWNFTEYWKIEENTLTPAFDFKKEDNIQLYPMMSIDQKSNSKFILIDLDMDKLPQEYILEFGNIENMVKLQFEHIKERVDLLNIIKDKSPIFNGLYYCCISTSGKGLHMIYDVNTTDVHNKKRAFVEILERLDDHLLNGKLSKLNVIDEKKGFDFKDMIYLKQKPMDDVFFLIDEYCNKDEIGFYSKYKFDFDYNSDKHVEFLAEKSTKKIIDKISKRVVNNNIQYVIKSIEIDEIINIVEKKYKENIDIIKSNPNGSNRNVDNTIYLIINLAHRLGLAEQTMKEYLLNNFKIGNIDEKYLLNKLKQVYSKIEDFGSMTKIAVFDQMWIKIKNEQFVIDKILLMKYMKPHIYYFCPENIEINKDALYYMKDNILTHIAGVNEVVNYNMKTKIYHEAFQNQSDENKDGIWNETAEYFRIHWQSFGFNKLNKDNCIQDNTDNMFLFLNNFNILKINKDNIKQIDLIEENKFVLNVKNQDIEKFKKYLVYDENVDITDLKRIFELMCRPGESLDYFMRCFGYIISTYQNGVCNPALYIFDKISIDDPEGGSGKTLFAKIISLFRKECFIDGKTIRPEWEFTGFTYGDQFIHHSDAGEYLNLEKYRNIIDGKFNIERKGRDTISIDYTPKLLFTSNYIPETIRLADRGRIIKFCFSNYFYRENKNKESWTIKDEYGHVLLEDEAFFEEDGKKITKFVIECCKLYLQKGIYDECPKEYVEAKQLISKKENLKIDEDNLLQYLLERFETFIETESSMFYWNMNLEVDKLKITSIEDIKRFKNIRDLFLYEIKKQYSKYITYTDDDKLFSYSKIKDEIPTYYIEKRQIKLYCIQFNKNQYVMDNINQGLFI